MVYLRNLNESLDKKYSLDEAYGDTFPKWFKDALTQSRKDLGVDREGQNARYLGKSDGKENAFDYNKISRPRGDNSSYKKFSLFNTAKEAGIDLQNTEIIEAPVPESKKDPLIQSDDILRIWGFPNGQVYIEGVNDREVYTGDEDGKTFTFTYLNPTALMKRANHFAYIKKDDLKPGMYREKSAYRDKVFNSMSNMYAEHPEMIKWNDKESNHFAHDVKTSGSKVDKSGYIVSPDRYKEELKKLHALDVFNMMDKWHDMLENIMIRVKKATMGIEDPTTYKGSSLPSLTDVRYLADDYKVYMKRINKILEAVDNNSMTKEEAKENLSIIKDDIVNIMKYSSLNDMFNHSAIPHEVNWLI